MLKRLHNDIRHKIDMENLFATTQQRKDIAKAFGTAFVAILKYVTC